MTKQQNKMDRWADIVEEEAESSETEFCQWLEANAGSSNDDGDISDEEFAKRVNKMSVTFKVTDSKTNERSSLERSNERKSIESTNEWKTMVPRSRIASDKRNNKQFGSTRRNDSDRRKSIALYRKDTFTYVDPPNKTKQAFHPKEITNVRCSKCNEEFQGIVDEIRYGRFMPLCNKCAQNIPNDPTVQYENKRGYFILKCDVCKGFDDLLMVRDTKPSTFRVRCTNCANICVRSQTTNVTV